uniref:Uncharacterized protein n=1 Tax=Solanum tuberosum TaxID=4113 RepID=M1DKN4_SOLTU
MFNMVISFDIHPKLNRNWNCLYGIGKSCFGRSNTKPPSAETDKGVAGLLMVVQFNAKESNAISTNSPTSVSEREVEQKQ